MLCEFKLDDDDDVTSVYIWFGENIRSIDGDDDLGKIEKDEIDVEKDNVGGGSGIEVICCGWCWWWKLIH